MWSKLTDLELDDEEQLDAVMPMPMERPRYPFGTKICLTNSELDKLGLDCDCDVGDRLDFKASAEVTCVSKDGDNKRVELQITRMAIAEDEDE